MPDDLGSNWGLLKVEACGVCGSDLDQYEGYYADSGMATYPTVPGHEMVGTLVQASPELTAARAVSTGDRVAVEATIPCHLCEYCQSGDGMLCPRKQFMYGFRSTTIEAGLWGGFSEYMVLRPGTALHRLSGELSPQDAVLYNPFAGGFEWAGRLAGTRPGDRVLILGPGMRGLGCVLAAREAGAAQIIVTGRARDARKLEIAHRLGATSTIVVDDVDTVEAVRDITGGRLVQRTVDTTPRAAAPVLHAIEATAPGGTIVLAGVKGSENHPVMPVDRIVFSGIRLVGAFGVNSWAYAQAVRLLNEKSARGLDFDDLHTHTFGLEDTARAITLLDPAAGREDVIHVSVLASP